MLRFFDSLKEEAARPLFQHGPLTLYVCPARLKWLRDNGLVDNDGNVTEKFVALWGKDCERVEDAAAPVE